MVTACFKHARRNPWIRCFSACLSGALYSPPMSEPTQPHVLVVDDDREIRDLLSRFLTKHGMRVTAARDGAEMMKAIGERGIDIVVLDVMLPGEDGLALCRRLRGQSGLPVIML